jgi:hypothetical protein
MAEIVRRVHPELKQAGFRKRRHTFNRSSEDGVVQVIGFQMGAKLPPGAVPIPGLRPDLYGLFTVNLGVAVREAWEQSMRLDKPFPAFINDYDCEIRERLGQVLGERYDVWWPLGAEPADTAAVIFDALTGPGLEWLAARGTREAILRVWGDGGLRALPTPTALPIVMILRHLDRPDHAAEVLRSYYDTITDHRPHRRHVYDVARSLQIDGLPPP